VAGTKSPGEWFLLTLERIGGACGNDVAEATLNGDGYLDAVAACASGLLVYFQNLAEGRGWPWPRQVLPFTAGRLFVRVSLAINRDGERR
jgi:hypothetical protein